MMERNTLTTFGQLRIGDRFYATGDKSKTAYEVTGPKKYNHIMNGKKSWMYDKDVKEDRLVMFLRHTVPIHGEQCMVEDLKRNHIFYLPDDIITEYRVKEQITGETIAYKLDYTDAQFIKHGTPVIFVRVYER
jgi:outer membrane lipoprotein-sorting protein